MCGRSRLYEEMYMSDWNDHSIEHKVREILADVPMDEQHDGRAFLTVYQIAIAFVQRFPDTARSLGYEIGGRGTGNRNTLAQYLARELVQRIKRETITSIECSSLSNLHLHDIVFEHNGATSYSPLTGSPFTLRMFRLTDD